MFCSLFMSNRPVTTALTAGKVNNKVYEEAAVRLVFFFER